MCADPYRYQSCGVFTPANRNPEKSIESKEDGKRKTTVFENIFQTL